MSTTSGKAKENIHPNHENPSSSPDQKRTAAWAERSPLQQLDQKRSTGKSLVESFATFFSSFSSSFSSAKQQPLEQEMRVMSSIPAKIRDLTHQEDKEVNRFLGEVRWYLQKKDFNKALETARKAHKLAPGNALCNYILGVAYACNNNKGDAYPYYLQAYLQEPTDKTYKLALDDIAKETSMPNSSSLTEILQAEKEESYNSLGISPLF